MRLYVLSDLHLEFAPFSLPDVEADVTVFAGDVHTGQNGLKWILEHCRSRPAIYVPGNHEFYGQTMQKLLRELKEAAAGTNVHVLDETTITINDVTFLGTTLWTDLEFFGDPVLGGTVVQTQMADFRRIRLEPGYSRLRAVDTRRLHLKARGWLKQQFAAKREGKLVVVSHHAPSGLSVPPMFSTDPVTAGYASHMDEFVRASGAALWVHGHVHTVCDYVLGKTRVLVNPRGYPQEAATAGFDPFLVAEI